VVDHDRPERAAALDWFSVEPIDETTFALTEDGHWEHVHCYLFVGSERAALVDTGTGIADIREVVRTLAHDVKAAARPLSNADRFCHPDTPKKRRPQCRSC
jgi:hypothetical protein